jgi:hypothetical protein
VVGRGKKYHYLLDAINCWSMSRTLLGNRKRQDHAARSKIDILLSFRSLTCMEFPRSSLLLCRFQQCLLVNDLMTMTTNLILHKCACNCLHELLVFVLRHYSTILGPKFHVSPVFPSAFAPRMSQAHFTLYVDSGRTSIANTIYHLDRHNSAPIYLGLFSAKCLGKSRNLVCSECPLDQDF